MEIEEKIQIHGRQHEDGGERERERWSQVKDLQVPEIRMRRKRIFPRAF